MLCVCVCVVFGKVNVCCFVLYVVYGVRCCLVGVYVCVNGLLFNVCVWFVRNVLCDVVWFVFLCVLSVFVCVCIKCVCALCLWCMM